MNRSAANNLAYEQIIKREISIRKTQKIKLNTSLKNKKLKGLYNNSNFNVFSFPLSEWILTEVFSFSMIY